MPRTRPTVLYFSPDERPIPQLILEWLDGKGFPLIRYRDPSEVEAVAQRSPPLLIIVDADGSGSDAADLCRSIKSDPYTGVTPVVFISAHHLTEPVKEWFAAGADEVVTPIFDPTEQHVRLDMLLTRTERTLSVNPSTRLPATTDIEREFRRRLDSGESFAVCYADLDRFKEYNDRYSYHEGDHVIYVVSRILRDVVNGVCAKEGFVGHIGGDDFILVIPVDKVDKVCREVIDTFDTLIPYQYSEEDRRAGYFFGKDRRGHLLRVSLMTISIGIITNEHRRMEHPGRISELANEMKNYAKTLPGSVFVVDRRRDEERAR